jgi:hypothetical protein
MNSEQAELAEEVTEKIFAYIMLKFPKGDYVDCSVIITLLDRLQNSIICSIVEENELESFIEAHKTLKLKSCREGYANFKKHLKASKSEPQ